MRASQIADWKASAVGAPSAGTPDRARVTDGAGRCWLLIAPSVLSALLMAAHLFRVEGPVAAAGVAILPFLLWRRRRWTLLVARGLALAGALAWVSIAGDLATARMAHGAPWLRLTAILGSAAAVNLLAGALLFDRRMERRHAAGAETAAGAAGAFLGAFGLLLLVRRFAGAEALLLPRFVAGGFWLEAAALAAYAAFIAERLQDDRRVARTRFVLWSVFSGAVFLQLALGLAGFERFLMSGALHLPVPAIIAAGPIYRGGGYFMFALFLATVAVAGPAWCSHFCYIGAWDNAFARRRPKAEVAPARRRRFDTRWLALAATAGAAFALRAAGASGTVAALLAGAFGLAGVAVMARRSRRTGRMAHCTEYCPIGALAVTLGRVSPFRLRINQSCPGCNLCLPVCRYGALTPSDLARGRPGSSCTLCGDCLSTCRRGLIEYRFPGLSPVGSRRLFVAVVAALMAVSLGVARL